MGRTKSDDTVDAIVFRDVALAHVDPRDRLCYRPEEAERVIPPWGCWIFVIRDIPTNPAPTPGCGYWARPWADGKDGYDSKGRYSVQVALPQGVLVRLWPYEYAILPEEEVKRALGDGELLFHPMGSNPTFHDMPEFRDMVGALQLDGLSLYQAVYELEMAGVEEAKDVQVPPPGWLEATFTLPWCEAPSEGEDNGNQDDDHRGEGPGGWL